MPSPSPNRPGSGFGVGKAPGGGFPFETCQVPAPFQPATDHFSWDQWRAILKTHLDGRDSEQSNTVVFAHPLIKKLMYEDLIGFLPK